MPLAANGFEAWVTIDGVEAQQFQLEDVDEPTGQTCYIASQLGKGFALHWKNMDVFCQTVGRIWVDGIECAGEIIRGPNFDARVAGRRTSADSVAPFLFAALELTDDDAFLDAAAHKDVGLIRMEVWTITQTGTRPYTSLTQPKETSSKIHERAKKGEGAHQIKFGAPVAEASRSAAVVQYLERVPLATFTFKYRSIDLLRANGIAPNPTPAAGKRKAEAGSSKQEGKGPKRVKKEAGHAFVPGEIIDLTRSKTPVVSSSEVIDLT
ncbi:hypothetical protein DFH09DRAFT_275651 [Mycena vulgaris]|nr:hypothetical protein DFH09DRAFT_275651 [Mycena vulgaris]